MRGCRGAVLCVCPEKEHKGGHIGRAPAAPGREKMQNLMYDQKLEKRLNRLTVSKYLFRLRAETPLRLPPYKGSAFHGAFGHALKRISPFYYQEIFENK